MELDEKLYLLDDGGEKFMGKGVLWLLEGIGESHSLRAAAGRMNLSYSKAHMMMVRLEKALGREIIMKRKGGDSRFGSELTPFAESFIELYKSFEEKAKKAAEEPYREFSEALERLFEEESDGRK